MFKKTNWLWAILLTVLAACSSGDKIPTQTPLPTGLIGPANIAPTEIPPAPAWIEPITAITVENAADIQYLGRLDPAGAPSSIFAYAFSPDGTRLAALNNSQLVAWDLITGQRNISTDRQDASYLYFSPDKSELFGLANNGVVKVFAADNGRVLNDFLAHPDFAGEVGYDRANGWLAVGGMDGSVKVWDPMERVSLVTIDAHVSEILALALSPDGTRLATAAAENLDTYVVRIWDWRAREQLLELNTEGHTPRRMAFSPDGQYLAVGHDTFIGIWQLSDGTFAYALQTGAGGSSDVLAYDPAGEYLLNGGDIPDMNVWDVQTGDLLALLPGLGGNRVSGAFSPDGDMLLASVLDGAVTLWDMRSITSETVVRANLNVGTEQVVAVDWSPDGYVMAFFDAAGPVHIWGIGESVPSAAPSNTG